MAETMRIIFLVLAVVMTFVGWNVSHGAVYFIWCLFCLEELVFTTVRARKKAQFAPVWFKALLYLGCGIFLVLGVVSTL